jgi:2-polyprenyl-3-methyl-5-hydroxy-6-metoxy-1,4-benzoquinol methylase
MDVYLEEYSSADAIRRYSSHTAGRGIDYLLKHDYANVYLRAVNEMLSVSRHTPLRLLEFGCGAGMNIITLMPLLAKNGWVIERAYGTDFSDGLIEAANREAQASLAREQRRKLSFSVARNEHLADDVASGTKIPRHALAGYFHIILGVNTFRYCHRLGKQRECARDIAEMLAPGGLCINIDMNRAFPAFKSKFRRRKTTTPLETYLPTLDEYTDTFDGAGLDVLTSENFCWIPHSAGPALLNVCRRLTPVLDVIAKPWAMRSLVVARKKRS